MKKSFILSLILFVVAFAASADSIWFVTGTDLNEWAVDFKMFIGGKDYNEANCYKFIEYITGVIDANYDLGGANGAKYFKIPTETTVDAVATAVSVYLDAHKDKLDDPGAYLVVEALAHAYPK